MQAILRRIPTAEDLSRNSAKIGGFAAGALGTLVIVLFFQVLYTGYGLSEDPTPAPVIYPNF